MLHWRGIRLSQIFLIERISNIVEAEMTYVVKFEKEETGDRDCEICGVQIPEARLKVLPHTTTCVRCSSEKPRAGIMVDTAGNNSGLELQMVQDPDNEYFKKELKR